MFRRTCSSLGALVILFLATEASAEVIVREGDVPTGGPDHFFIPFTVPAGTAEIEIRHDDLSEMNILDWGLLDPTGYRGWGGGTSEPIVVNEKAASRAYVRGPLTPGEWRVVVGKAKVVASPAKYKVEIDLKTTATLAEQTERKPYAPSSALKKERRWYAGDFHVHSKESTDASPTLDENATFARSRGLDFIELSEHNTITQLDYFTDAQAKHPDILLLPGIEYTTYQGHGNAIGATQWVDHKIGQPGVTIEGALEKIHAQGALFAINHPALAVGDLCIGCEWKHQVDPKTIDAVEIATWGLSEGSTLSSPAAIRLWDDLCAKGRHAAAIGGSDDHSGGKKQGGLGASPIGNPTTMVLADELSVAGILDGVKNGRTVVKLQDPNDPMIELGSIVSPTGDTVKCRGTRLQAKITGAKDRNATVRYVKNGELLAEAAVDADPFVHEMAAMAPQAGEDRYRVEVLLDGTLRSITSHLFVTLDPNGPDLSAKPPTEDDSGCNTSSRSPLGLGVPLVLLCVLAVVRRGRRRR